MKDTLLLIAFLLIFLCGIFIGQSTKQEEIENRAKKDMQRYRRLQKHYELLEKYDFETLDNFEFAIYDTYEEQEDRDKITKLFKKLTKHIEKAQKQILTESKTYL